MNKVKLSVLYYHDVFDVGNARESGFPGAAANRYKLTRAEFRAHLDAFRAAGLDDPVAPEGGFISPALRPWVLTFDDGGITAFTVIAAELASFGWKGCFFMTTGRIGDGRFMDKGQIRELRRMGHVIGSHSHTHPDRMSILTHNELLDEWRRSRGILEDILGEPVLTASVPGGYYTKHVAIAADEAGIKTLFTSEPTRSPSTVGGCTVLGRYMVLSGMPGGLASRLASGDILECGRQLLWWNTKKAAKSIGGKYYLRLRSILLNKKPRL